MSERFGNLEDRLDHPEKGFESALGAHPHPQILHVEVVVAGDAVFHGPDSDDFTIYFAYNNNKLAIIPSINYERHNITHPNALVQQYANTIVYDNFYDKYFIEENRTILYDMSHLAEGKIELKLDIRYLFKGFRFSFYYELETIYNKSFLHSSAMSGVQKKSTNVLWIGVEKSFDGKINTTLKDIFKNITS